MTIECPKCQTNNPDSQKFCGECATPLPGIQDAFHTKTLETPTEELTRGSVFASRYEIIEELGKGGMGRVYRVEDKKIKQEIALKLIRPEIAADKKTIERFKNELKTARNIRHKNVCGMFDLGEEKGSHFITMEYVSGGDLKRFIRRSKRLDTGTAISIAKQICEGLEEAHSMGIVHRDLKPNNIMIDDNGSARIMDFGIARTVKGKGITGSGVMIGTPEYMSPEQAEAKEVDRRSDIYSLGVILYEMTTGRLPFEGDTPLAVAMKHKGDTAKSPKEFNPQIPDDLSGVILKCLEKEKENRYQNAGEVKSEFERIEQGLPTTDRVVPERKSITSKEITVKFTPKKLLIPAAAVVVLVAAGLFLLLRPKGPSLNPNRIVVALFENKTDDKSLDYIGAMAADWITQGLAQTGLVEVVPTTTLEAVSIGFQGENLSLFLAKETGAGTVVSGTYYLQGETISFQAQVTDVKVGKLLSSLDPVSGPVKDPLKPIESLRQQLMGTLAIVFDPMFEGFLDFTSFTMPNYKAYQEYLEGVKFFSRREYSKAIEHLSLASDFDNAFILPVLHAAVAHLNLGQYAEAEALSREVEKSREKLTKSDLIWLDWLQSFLRGDRFGQLRASRQQAQLNPGSIWIYQLGLDANRNNLPQETIDAYAKLDPEMGLMKGWFPYWNRLTSAYHMLGKHKTELEEARQGRKQFPELLSTLSYEVRALVALGKIDTVNKRLDECLNLPSQRSWSPGTVMLNASHELRAHGYKEDSIKVAERAIAYYKSRFDGDYRYSLARSFYFAERWEEAKELFKILAEKSPDNINYMGHLGTIAARLGNREEAMRISRELQKIERPYIFGNNVYWRACIASLLGEKELAMKLLRDALAKGVSYRWLHPDIDLEPLEDYPPFIELKKPKG